MHGGARGQEGLKGSAQRQLQAWSLHRGDDRHSSAGRGARPQAPGPGTTTPSKSSSVRSQDTGRKSMPVACGDRKKAMPDARWRARDQRDPAGRATAITSMAATPPRRSPLGGAWAARQLDSSRPAVPPLPRDKHRKTHRASALGFGPLATPLAAPWGPTFPLGTAMMRLMFA